MKELIRRLTETFSPSGCEEAIRETIRKEVRGEADEIHVDALGNLVVRKGRGGKKVMVAAHMDEIGLMATHVDDKGFVRFAGIGGVHPCNLPGGRVRFVAETASSSWGNRFRSCSISVPLPAPDWPVMTKTGFAGMAEKPSGNRRLRRLLAFLGTRVANP